MTTNRSARALLVVAYIGKFGPWFPLYLYSLSKQHTLDLLLVGDTKPAHMPRNARHIHMTLSEIRGLAEEKLKTPSN